MNDRDRLAELLAQAVGAVIEVANHRGFRELPEREYTVEWWEPTDPTRATGMSEVGREPFYFVLSQELREQIERDDRVAAMSGGVAAFANNKGKFMVMTWPGQAEALGQRLLHVYFDRVRALRVDATVVNEVCDQLVADLLADTAVIRTVYLIENFGASAPFDLGCLGDVGEIQFRPSTVDDRDRYTRIDVFSACGRPPRLNPRNWICEIRRQTRKDTMAVFNSQGEQLDEIVGALNLTKHGRATFQLLQHEIESPFLSVGMLRGGLTGATSRIGDPINLTVEDVNCFSAIYADVQGLSHGRGPKQLALAFRRLRVAASRQQSEDAFVDYVIGLESILANDSERLETTFRFRLRGAALLPEFFGTASERMKLMSDLYDIRSRIVHGNAKPSEVSAYSPRAEQVLRTVLVWCLRNSGRLAAQGGRVTPALDEELVRGGAAWAYHAGQS
jgi:hypothetical protein